MAAGAFSLGASLASPPAIADDATESVHLVYRAPAECPSVDELMAKLHEQSRRILIEDSAGATRVLEVTVDGNGLHGMMVVTKDGAASGSREVTAATCGEVVDVLAFAATLVLDSTATPPTPDSLAPDTPPLPEAPPPPSPAPALPARARPEPRARPESRAATSNGRPTWELAAEGSLSTAVSPNVTAAGGLAGGVSIRLGRLFPQFVVAGDYGASAPARVPGEPGATVRFSRLLASLEGCPTRLRAGPFALRGCLRIEGGERTTVGEGLKTPRVAIL
jgi:hypothetical protein